MTTADPEDDFDERFGEACGILTTAAIKIAKELGICPFCLIYATATIAKGAQMAGEAHHICCSKANIVPPQHKTVV